MPHVLIIRRSALGDVAMTIPVVYSVARAYPQVTFTVLTLPPFDELFLTPPANLHVVTHLSQCKQPFTHVADLHNVPYSWALDAWFCLRRCHVAMVDKRRSERRRIIRQKAIGESFIERYRFVFQRLGFPVDVTFNSLFEEERQPSIPLTIGVAPFARYATKTYPLDIMFQVVRQLANLGYHIQLYGAKDSQAHLLAQWAETIPECECMAGRFALADELRSMAHLTLMVSMDSANGHLASLAGVPVLTIWGGTTPSCGFAPYHQTACHLPPTLPCQPCSIAGYKRCRRSDFACFHCLSPQTLVQAICDSVKRITDDAN